MKPAPSRPMPLSPPRGLPMTAAELLGRLRAGAAQAATTGWHAGLRFASHFQPIYSLSHGRIVGHEALLRATGADGRPVPPPEVFDTDDLDELWVRDWLARAVHMANHAQAAPEDQWLFLNAHPALFGRWQSEAVSDFLFAFGNTFELPPQRLVIEVLESALEDDHRLQHALQEVRHRGCLIALDDFGAGHSNFDRVWQLRPEIVKLDRSLVARAASDRNARRVVAQIVSLLHECGTLVLMEGIETPEEAFVALEADADLVQGYLFGRPQARLAGTGQPPAALEAVWQAFEARWRDDRRRAVDRMAPYQQAMGVAARRLMAGEPLEAACAPFLQLPGTELCYLLGADGRQIDGNCWSARMRQGDNPATLAFAPLRDARGARWSRRPYFRRAVNAPGQVQMTRPYRTLHGGHLSVTVSIAFTPRQGGGLQVICGDLGWDAL